MTIVDQPRTAFQLATFDLYRNIHKAIRSELFSAILAAGELDASDAGARADFASRTTGLVDLLVSHAEHEDGAIGPALEIHLPLLAELIETDHHRLDARIASLHDMAVSAVDLRGAAQQREAIHRVYLELASFTSEYLEHQDVEERELMPQLEAAIGVEACVAIHGAILSSIPPQEMAQSLAIMLPRLNIDDRTEMLGGMRAEAPAEVFAGVWALTGSVLTESDYADLGRRLGLD